jgi:subtilisin-like proprotein convertase family protein
MVLSGAEKPMKASTFWTFILTLAILVLVPAAGIAASPQGEVVLRSGVVEPDGAPSPAAASKPDALERWVVRFRRAPGWFERAAVETAGARVEAPLPGQAYLVSIPAARANGLAHIPSVEWATPFLPQHKIAPEIDAVRSGRERTDSDVVVLLHVFADADAESVADALAAAGLRVEGARDGKRFDRVVLIMSPEEVETRTDELAERGDVFWVGRRHRRVLTNDTSIWVGQSGLYAGETTPVFDRGIYGEGQVAAVLDTGLDADMCYFRDEALGLPPTNTGGATTVDPNQRKVIAVDFLDPAEDPANPGHWDTQGHGTHVAGILSGDDLANPILHDHGDGMAPGAKLLIQDAGYAADACGDLPGIGCPVTDLIPIFQQTYDQGARTHSNSWNDNENAAVQNIYTDASEDVDEFMWNNPDFLIVFACGNHALGGTGTIGSPSTAKNTLSVGGTFKGQSAEYLSDISAWGPTDDGRIKPDVVFPSASIQSAANDGDVTTDNCATAGYTGTSMAAPGAAGMSLLVRDYFAQGFYPSGAANPADAFEAGSALVKAMLINSAVPIGWDAEGRPITIPSDEQGWGRILLDNTLKFASDERGLWVEENTAGFSSPSDPPAIYQLEVTDSAEPLKITLVWNDYPSTPAASTHLLNDLDLRVDGAGGGWLGNVWNHGVSIAGGTYDRLNNVEQVYVETPAPGVYSIQVMPHAIPFGPQPYALVVSGAGFTVTSGPQPSHFAHTIDDSGPNGNGDGVLDPGETVTVAVNLRNAGDAEATSVIGDIYSVYPDRLKVYRKTTSYTDMPVGGHADSAAPHYEVTLEPSATCGQVLGASMTISGSGFEVGSGFTLDIGEYQGQTPSTDTPLAIPRNSTTGANSYINVPVGFPLTRVYVTVNIDHPDIGDLDVLVYPPGGTNPPVYLHNNTGAGTSGIHTTYDSLTPVDGPGDLADFVGLDPQGNWRLKVVNSGSRNGTLEDWTLHLESDIPFDCNPVNCADAVPPAVGDTLTVARSGATDVQVSWSGVGGAADYHLWRSPDPTFENASFAGASGGATSVVDPGAQTLAGIHYYLVRSSNSCRWESD